MIDNLPKPIALYIEAENSGDVNLFDQCFTDNAVVFDENERHDGLTAIKEWKSETKRKYQHTVEPLSIVQKEGRTIVTNRLTENFREVRSNSSSLSHCAETRSSRSRSFREAAAGFHS